MDVGDKFGRATTASINADSLRTNDAFIRITNLTQWNNIDIDCAREAHNERIDAQEVGKYKTFFGGNDAGADEKR